MEVPMFKVGQKVQAMGTITENGGPADEAAEFPAGGYIHARVGDMGVVLHLNDEGLPTVRFEHTGTATIVGTSEVKLKCQLCGLDAAHETVAECMRDLMNYVEPRIRETPQFQRALAAGYEAMKIQLAKDPIPAVD
jgi:hypothetical protein